MSRWFRFQLKIFWSNAFILFLNIVWIDTFCLIFQTSLELNRTPFLMQQEAASPPIIERDAHGKPIRRGFIPVEEKIQKELRDIRSRETELKRMRRNQLLQSQPDLLDCVDQGVEWVIHNQTEETRYSLCDINFIYFVLSAATQLVMTLTMNLATSSDHQNRSANCAMHWHKLLVFRQGTVRIFCFFVLFINEDW